MQELILKKGGVVLLLYIIFDYIHKKFSSEQLAHFYFYITANPTKYLLGLALVVITLVVITLTIIFLSWLYNEKINK